jgi:hypothetical protein
MQKMTRWTRIVVLKQMPDTMTLIEVKSETSTLGRLAPAETIDMTAIIISARDKYSARANMVDA